MQRLKRLARLTSSDWRLLLRAFFVVGMARAALWVLPLELVRRVVRKSAGAAKQIPVERYVWAVKVASRYLPGATCLTQALAAQALLARAGHESHIELGVAKDGGQRLEAHAWVICRKQIVIGGPEVERYARLTAWEP